MSPDFLLSPEVRNRLAALLARHPRPRDIPVDRWQQIVSEATYLTDWEIDILLCEVGAGDLIEIGLLKPASYFFTGGAE